MSRVDSPSSKLLAVACATCVLLGPMTHARAAAPVVVSQIDRAFAQKEIQIKPGATVRFTNDDEFAHQIYVDSPGFSFESNEQDPGQAVNVTFPKPGTYIVQCHIHPKMRMRVEVR